MTSQIRRHVALLGLVLLVLAGCGTTPAPTDNGALPNGAPTDDAARTPAPTPTPLGTEDPDEGLIFDSLTLERSGGLAGELTTITVVGNGALLNDGEVVGSITQEEVTNLDSQIDRMGFFRLDAQYGPAQPRPDTYVYEITVERNNASSTVKTMDGFVPESLQRLIRSIQSLVPTGPAPAPTSDDTQVEDATG